MTLDPELPDFAEAVRQLRGACNNFDDYDSSVLAFIRVTALVLNPVVRNQQNSYRCRELCEIRTMLFKRVSEHYNTRNATIRALRGLAEDFKDSRLSNRNFILIKMYSVFQNQVDLALCCVIRIDSVDLLLQDNHAVEPNAARSFAEEVQVETAQNPQPAADLNR